MASWQIAVVGAYAVIVFIAAVRHWIYSIAMRKTPWLTPSDPQADPKTGPLVSILIPAKDEEHSIEECVRSLLAQEYDRTEILVADDRSVDRTAEIVRTLERESEKVRLVPIRKLPEGWTGKTNALHQCQQHAQGEWLLFVDADTRHRPQCLGVVLQDAMTQQADLESLLPSLDSRSFWEKAIQPFAGICLMVFFPLHLVNDPSRKRLGFANGQFILIRRSAYDQIGGHEAVKDKFVEDVQLGRHVRQADLKLRVALAPDLSAVRMYSDLGAIVRGWSRILYSAVDAKPFRLYVLFISIWLFSVLSYVVLIAAGAAYLAGRTGAFVTTMLVLGAIHQTAQTALMARIYRTSRSRLRYLLYRPLAVAVMLGILIRTIRMCRTHDVVWRGTSYSGIEKAD